MNDGYKFKKKSCEDQFKFGVKLMDSLQDAESALSRNNETASLAAKEKNSEGKEIITHRQKLIKIADDSDMGWKTVKEYEVNPLVEDSDDEKRLLRAEARANRRSKQQKQRKNQRRYNPYGTGYDSYGSGYAPYGTGRWSSTSTSTQPMREQSVFPEARRQGLCFLCRRSGHWKKDCPELGRQSNNKISILGYQSICIDESESSISSKSEDSVNKVFSPNASVSIIKQSNTNMIESHSIEVTATPVGRLKSAEAKWKTAGANDYIMKVVSEGYSIPFRELPPSKIMLNNKTARDNMTFVKEEVCKLLKKGCVAEVKEAPFVVNPLTVAYNRAGKPRLVLDCRHLNQFLVQYKFKFEDINTAVEMFDEGSYLFCFDLKGAYHHISIRPDMRKYLRFAITEGGITRYYVFCVLAFGIATAGFIFSKLLRVVVKYLRGQGHKVVMYLDDGIGGHSKYDTALQLSTHVRSTLMEFGFLLTHEKCHWDPVKVQVWLGYVIDMIQSKLFVTEERIASAYNAIVSLIDHLDRSCMVKVRVLASVEGKIISMQSVFGKLVCLRTRALHECIISRASWEAPVVVTEEAVCELQFWKGNVKVLNENGRPLKADLSSEVELYCDASSDGYGGYLCMGNESEAGDTDSVHKVMEQSTKEYSNTISDGSKAAGDGSNSENGNIVMCQGRSAVYDGSYTICGGNDDIDDVIDDYVICADSKLRNMTEDETNVGHSLMTVCPGQNTGNEKVYRYENQNDNGELEVTGTWSEREKVRSSTWRELEAVKRVMFSKRAVLKNKKVKVFSDNQNIKTILKAGSMKNDLQIIALDIYEFCTTNKITVIPVWIPRQQNERADYLSRSFDCDDWEISDNVFSILDSIWGPHSIDRFASNYNSKCFRFNSRWWLPGAEAVNAFDQCWEGDCNWMVPPPRLIVLCLSKLKHDRACGTLVVPEWFSAPFWVQLVDTNGVFQHL